MKRIFLLASVVTLLVASVYATQVDSMRAINVAEQFMPASKPAAQPGKAQAPAQQQTSEIVYTHYMPKSGKPAIYVVNIGNGFALVSADDVAHPVLGYNYGKAWPTDGQPLPPSVKGFLDDLAAQMEAASEHPQDAETATEWQQPRRAPHRAKMDSNLPDSVGPLLTTTWDQGQYYNSLCPADGQGPDGHVYTGCVATAMAQIIKYWGDRETIKTRGIHSYESNYGTLTVNYDSTSYDFANMPNALTSTSTPQEVNAVAKLMYHCGVAVNMGYGSTESGSSDISMRIALNNNYCFNNQTQYIVKQSSVFQQWDSLLIVQIQDSLPILYNAFDTTRNIGHSYVCDGYKQDGYFHFNFGWSGNGDGWYKTSAINPGVWKFNSSQSALINIWPSANNSTLFQYSEGRNTIHIEDSLVHVYHSFGLNDYRAAQAQYFPAWNTWVFYSSEEGEQLEFDLNKHPTVYNATNKIYVYDGANSDSLLHEYDAIRNYWNGTLNLDRTPLVSTRGALTITCNSVDGYEGSDFIISKYNGCRRATEMKVDYDVSSTSITWRENGDAVQWQVEYGLSNFEHGTGNMLIVDTPYILFDTLSTYKDYDIYVRPICGEGIHGLWSQKCTFMVEKDLWRDIVTSQPTGYQIGSDSTIYISSAEGLAWLSRILYGGVQNGLEGWTIHLTNDIDLYGHTWVPISQFKGIFQGHGHYIKNMYGSQGGALFGLCYSPLINDVHIRDAHVRGPACIVGILSGRYMTEGKRATLMNSSATGIVHNDDDNAGGLVGYISDSAAIINCWSSCDVYGRLDVGGICGRGDDNCLLQNCYTNGYIHALKSFGAMIGRTEYTHINKCYALLDNFHPLSSLWPSGLGSQITESQWFSRNNDDWRLLDTSKYPGSEELLAHALNNAITDFNRDDLRTWVIDSCNNNFPDFGPYFEVKCTNVSGLTLQNVIGVNQEYGVAVSWKNTTEATQYELRYHIKDSLHEQIVALNSNPDTLYGLSPHTAYMFSIRANCDLNTHSGWSDEKEFVVDKPYWTDVVTSMPNGYSMDDQGNVIISSEEGLAWLISTINGLNGQQSNNYEGRSVILTQDVDMTPYKWTAMSGFLGDFNGGNHTIDGLNIYELTDYNGFFGLVNGGIYRNIMISNADIRCKQYAGILFGKVSNANIVNCHTSGNVSGDNNVGGIAGWGEKDDVNLCSYNGNIHLDWHYGGGLFGNINKCYIKNSYTQCNVAVYGYGGGGLVGPCYSGVIENCYSLAHVEGFMHLGTLIGSLYSTEYFDSAIKNCYGIGNLSSWATFIEETVAMGGIIGVTNLDPIITSCYGNISPLVGPAEEGSPVVNDTTLVAENLSLSETIRIGQYFYTDLLSALNAWVDANNSEGKYRHWVADTENINGGFPIFDPTESPTTDIESVQPSNINVQKILYNSQILILRGNKIYNIDGQLVR